MDWRHAFITQARSDYALLEQLNRTDCAYCHRLHYLQMMSEKLAKGLMMDKQSGPPDFSHTALVRMMQNLKGRPELRILAGFSSPKAFKRFIDSLLDLSRNIELLAPASAGMHQPNPEYPWVDKATGEISAPCEYEFPGFDPANAQMVKLTGLLQRLLRIAG